MKDSAYIVIGKNGIRALRKTKPDLNWDELSFKVDIEVPDIFFQRPLFEAKIKIEDNALLTQNITDLIINTKEIIEQQTGAKIDFRIIEEKKEEG